jgi:hypothetical protein
MMGGEPVRAARSILLSSRDALCNSCRDLKTVYFCNLILHAFGTHRFFHRQKVNHCKGNVSATVVVITKGLWFGALDHLAPSEKKIPRDVKRNCVCGTMGIWTLEWLLGVIMLRNPHEPMSYGQRTVRICLLQWSLQKKKQTATNACLNKGPSVFELWFKTLTMISPPTEFISIQGNKKKMQNMLQ